MSKRKPSKSRKIIAAEPVAKKRNTGFGKSFAQMMFVVVGALSAFYIIFLALTPKKGDTINEYISQNLPRLMTMEWVLYSAIALGFLYFSFKWVFRMDKKIYDHIALGLVFLAINGLFVLSFDKDLGSFGDNAQYIVHSKSLIEKGGPYNLYFINESYKAKAPIGLPLMLSPITATFGMDVFKMKALVFFLGAMSLVFFFLSFRKLCGPYLAALLTTVIGTYPLFIYNTSYIMTEVPFIFTISIALFSAIKLKESQGRRQVAIWAVLAVLTALLSYLTRAVGVAMIGAIIMWLFVHVPWRSIFKKETKFLALPTYKFMVVAGALAVLFLGWQLKTSAAVKRDQARRGVQEEQVAKADEAKEADKKEATQKSSQLAQFLGTDFTARFSGNFKKVKRLWPQQIYNKQLSRWYFSLGKASNIKEMNGALRFFNIMLFISLVLGLARRDLVAFAFLFLMGVTLAGTSTPVLMVYSRYFIPMVPFMIYLMARAIPDIVDFINERKPVPVLQGFASFGASIFLFMILYHNFSGNAYNTQRQNAGDAYTIAFDNYLKSGTWVNENLGEDAIIASRKPRLYYVFSERKGVYTVTYSNQTYSKELEEDRIDFFREKNIDYVILDAFSTASRKVILPIIQNNPDKFQVVKSIGEKYPSHVVRFIDQ